MNARELFRLCTFALVASALVWTAAAQSLFDRLVMPGELIEGHAKLEKECTNCHEPFSKGSQSKLCLNCHTEIARDRQEARGFHGKRSDAVRADCSHCHTDHKGRRADIVQFDRETFNHSFANFLLAGAHRTVRCESCHAPNVKFRKAPSLCINCHKDDDPHKGRLGDGCQACHTEESWSRVRTFDHSKTHFPLVGAHAQVVCAACHAAERYKGTPTACIGCHKLQDVHQERYGAKCATCHQSTKWASIRFDHGKATKFPLRGAHATVKCDTCHLGDLYKDKLPTNCVGCHKKDDAHKEQLGPNCQQCHNETSWRKKVAFDHDLTRFPLLGRHGLVACEQCHKTTSFKDTPAACSSCHADRHHDGRLGSNCAFCHTPVAWGKWRFDHDKQTMFPLTGAHAAVMCSSCHREKNVSKISLPTACYACHASDDAHGGNFGRACEKCHNTKSFR